VSFSKALLLSIASSLLVGCSEGSPLLITGDSQAVGTEIFVDGKRIGVMERRIYSGPSPADHLAPASSMKRGDVFAANVGLRAPRGSHEIAFVHTDGRRLVKRIDVRHEVYIGVSFSEMRISGGD